MQRSRSTRLPIPHASKRSCEAPGFAPHRFDGKLTPVEVDSADPSALRLSLLPGDWVEWE